MGNGNDDISSEEHFENSKPGEVTTRTVHFCLNILILSRDPVPLIVQARLVRDDNDLGLHLDSLALVEILLKITEVSKR